MIPRYELQLAALGMAGVFALLLWAVERFAT